MNRNFYLSVIVVTIVSFFAGWVIFGMALMDYYSAHTNEAAKSIMKDENSMVMWAIVVSNLATSVLITWILQKTGDRTFASGFKTSLLISFLIMLGFGMGLYAFWDLYDMQLMLVDIIAGSLFWGLMGGIAGWLLGRGTPATA